MKYKGVDFNKEDVIKAMEDIDKRTYGILDCKNATTYQLNNPYNGKKYPIKQTMECIMRRKGIIVDNFSDYIFSNKNLRDNFVKLGFKIERF